MSRSSPPDLSHPFSESLESEDDLDDDDCDEEEVSGYSEEDLETTRLLNLHAGAGDSFQYYKEPDGSVSTAAQLGPASVHNLVPNGTNHSPVRITIPPSAIRRSHYSNGYLAPEQYTADDFAASNDPEAQLVQPGRHAVLEHPRKRYPKEIKKTFIACLFMSVNFVLTAISLAFVHEDRPLYNPLPDQILDRIHYQQWALYGCEILISCQTTAAAVVILFHRHRFIVLRRMMLIIGVLYLYRAITMWVTVLPSADPNYECAPKFNGPLTFKEVFHRVFQIITGFGLSINGKHVYCGDFIYSGHTMMTILGYLIVNEYTPRNLWLLQWATLVNAVTAIVLLLLSRGHYSVDVIIAYFVVTRLWAIYHTLAGHLSLQQEYRSPLNHFSRFWWFRGFAYMEANVKAGKLPNEFNWPLQFLRSIKNRLRLKKRGKGLFTRVRKARRRSGPEQSTGGV